MSSGCYRTISGSLSLSEETKVVSSRLTAVNKHKHRFNVDVRSAVRLTNSLSQFEDKVSSINIFHWLNIKYFYCRSPVLGLHDLMDLDNIIIYDWDDSWTNWCLYCTCSDIKENKQISGHLMIIFNVNIQTAVCVCGSFSDIALF